LSGTLQGAGGIGGLLARTDNSQLMVGSPWASASYCYDGNGNVMGLVYTNGTLAAEYNYDPFGNLQLMSGPLAQANKIRFSSKEWDDLAGLYYYLYRFYDPNLQRWVNRDPAGEMGGINLFGYIANDALNYVDIWGLLPTFDLPPGWGGAIGTTLQDIIIPPSPPSKVWDPTAPPPDSSSGGGGISSWPISQTISDAGKDVSRCFQNGNIYASPPGSVGLDTTFTLRPIGSLNNGGTLGITGILGIGGDPKNPILDVILRGTGSINGGFGWGGELGIGRGPAHVTIGVSGGNHSGTTVTIGGTLKW
jgi:RHS repeat-associated protein